jgi:hypothetical protein
MPGLLTSPWPALRLGYEGHLLKEQNAMVDLGLSTLVFLCCGGDMTPEQAG